MAKFDDPISSTLTCTNNGVSSSQSLSTVFKNNIDCLKLEPGMSDTLKTNGTTTQIVEDPDVNNKIENNVDQKSPFGKFLLIFKI